MILKRMIDFRESSVYTISVNGAEIDYFDIYDGKLTELISGDQVSDETHKQIMDLVEHYNAD